MPTILADNAGLLAQGGLAIAELGGETTLSRLASRTGLNISTCHHLLATLVARGFVTKGLGRRGYALGARILYLSHVCLQVDLPRRAQSAVDRINQATGETVQLAALQGDELVNVLKRESRHAKRVLEALSEQTGGAAYFPKSIKEVDAIAAEVAQDIRTQYTISYHSTKSPTSE